MNARKLLAGAALAIGLTTTATALPATAAPAQAYAYNWGAIAYDWDGNTAWAINYGSEQGAADAAMARCGSDCGYISFYNSCGAVAYGQSATQQHIGRASGYPTRAAAERAAKSKVPVASQIGAWACTDR